MADCQYADVSSYQPVVDDSYPYRFIAIRSNDGTYVDPNFAANLAWAKSAITRGRLDGFIVYFVYETNWQQTLTTLKANVGAPHPRMAVMIDMESWSGRIRGDQTIAANALRAQLVAWLGDKRRVLAYGNAGDLAALWPGRGDIMIALADYTRNPSFPGKIIHQYADNAYVPPFGRVDINSADGYTPAEFAAALGLSAPPHPPTPHQPTEEYEMKAYILHDGNTPPQWWVVAGDLSTKTPVTPDAATALLATGQYLNNPGIGQTTLSIVPAAHA